MTLTVASAISARLWTLVFLTCFSGRFLRGLLESIAASWSFAMVTIIPGLFEEHEVLTAAHRDGRFGCERFVYYTRHVVTSRPTHARN